jgi:aminobenzoyl-glutamate utilization protein B
VPQETRMHYIVTRGGSAANIVPDVAELSLIVRHPDRTMLESIWARVVNCANAGALAAGVTVEVDITSSYSNILLNRTLSSLLDRSLHESGGVRYTPEEQAFAARLRATLDSPLPPLELASQVGPLRQALMTASTDVGDVSWVVPTGQFFAATFPPGIPLHSWQSTAAAGTSLGEKGMLVAARTLALASIDLFLHPAAVKAAQDDFARAREGREYRSLLPDGALPRGH